MTALFEPFTLRSLTFPNRVWLPPMCQYSATDGVPNDWHLVHLGARVLGGFGLVIAEATAVSPEGRITPDDTGLYNDEQVAAWRRITDFAHRNDGLIGVQLAHAGRKASTFAPWRGHGTVPVDQGGWATVAPSGITFPRYTAPREMSTRDIEKVVADFGAAAARAHAAGFDVIEIHAAHGYLVHEFLSPLSNMRTDAYGGSLENRARLLLEILDAVRANWPNDLPVVVRYSATDWLEGGLVAEQIGEVAGWAGEHGADLSDVSTGGVLPAHIALEPGYQVPSAEIVRRVSGLPASAVGLITEPAQANEIVESGVVDAVMIGRAALRDAEWPLRAAFELGVADAGPRWPAQYERGAWPDRAA